MVVSTTFRTGRRKRSQNQSSLLLGHGRKVRGIPSKASNKRPGSSPTSPNQMRGEEEEEEEEGEEEDADGNDNLDGGNKSMPEHKATDITAAA